MPNTKLEHDYSEDCYADTCCAVCGAVLITEARFCRWCGHALNATHSALLSEATTRRLAPPVGERNWMIPFHGDNTESLRTVVPAARPTQPLVPLKFAPRGRSLFAVSLAMNCLLFVALAAFVAHLNPASQTESAFLAMNETPLSSDILSSDTFSSDIVPPVIVQERLTGELPNAVECPESKAKAASRAKSETRSAPAKVNKSNATAIVLFNHGSQRISARRKAVKARDELETALSDEINLSTLVNSALREAKVALKRERTKFKQQECNRFVPATLPVPPVNVSAGAPVFYVDLNTAQTTSFAARPRPVFMTQDAKEKLNEKSDANLPQR